MGKKIFLPSRQWRRKTIAAVGPWLGGLFALHVYAAPVASAPAVQINSVNDIICYIFYGFDLMFWFLIALAVIMAMVGAYNYLTSQGDAEKISKGTKTLMWAAVAVAVALIAYNVPNIVGSFFEVSIMQPGISCN